MPDPLKAKVRPSLPDHSKSTRQRVMELVPAATPWFDGPYDKYSIHEHMQAASIAMNLETDDMPPDMAERWKQS